MHHEANLVSVEQRRYIQLLCLMLYTNFVNVERVFARNTRQGHRYNFRVDNYQSSSPNIYKEARKRTLPYCHTLPIMFPLTPYGNPMLGPVLAFPHGLPYCFRLFHGTTRFMLSYFF